MMIPQLDNIQEVLKIDKKKKEKWKQGRKK